VPAVVSIPASYAGSIITLRAALWMVRVEICGSRSVFYLHPRSDLHTSDRESTGVTAADRAITGANSLVNRDTPGAKVSGSPARIRARQHHPSENVSYDLKEVETPDVARPVFTTDTDRKRLREKPSR
jgi:hypothetical protein